MTRTSSRRAALALLAAAVARGDRRRRAGVRAAKALADVLGQPVVAVVLLGSYARGRAIAASDLDLLVVTRGPTGDAPGLTAPSVDVDLRLVALEDFRRDGLEPWYCVGPLPVLFDPEGHARRALRVARALYAAGPPPCSRARLQVHRRWALRMERRIAAELESNPPLAALRLARLRVRLAELSFEVRGQWPRADRDAVSTWRRDDPELFRAFAAIAACRSPDDEFAALRRVRRVVLGA